MMGNFRCVAAFSLALLGLSLAGRGPASEPQPPKGFRAIFNATGGDSGWPAR